MEVSFLKISRKSKVVCLLLVGVYLLSGCNLKDKNQEMETYLAQRSIFMYPKGWVYSEKEGVTTFCKENSKDFFAYSDNIELTLNDENFDNLVQGGFAGLKTGNGKIEKSTIKIDDKYYYLAKLETIEDNLHCTASVYCIQLENNYLGTLLCMDYSGECEKFLERICTSLQPLDTNVQLDETINTEEILKQYNSLKENMKYEEVVQILGSEGEICYGEKGDNVVGYIWSYGGFPTVNILMTFYEGRLNQKAQVGLE